MDSMFSNQKLITDLNKNVEEAIEITDPDSKNLTIEQADELVQRELVEPTLISLEEQITALNKHLDRYFEYNVNEYSVDARMKILNAGIRAMRNEIEKTEKQEKRLENSLKLYNWAATKITDIMNLSKKTAGFITLIGLFSIYLPSQIKSQLSDIPYLREFFAITDLLSPVIMNAQQIAAASASGYYVLIQAGFTQQEIISFFSKLSNNVQKQIEDNVINPFLNFIGSSIGRQFYQQELKNIEINFGDTPPPSLSQAIHNITKLQHGADQNILNIVRSLHDSSQQLAVRVNIQTQEFGTPQIKRSISESEISSQPRSKRLRVEEPFGTQAFGTQAFGTPRQTQAFGTQEFGTPRQTQPFVTQYDDDRKLSSEEIHGGKKRRHKKSTHRKRKGRSQSYRKRKYTNHRKSRRHTNRRKSRRHRR